MIARIWSARTTPAQAPAYATHLQTHVLPALRATDGYGGAMLLQRATSAPAAAAGAADPVPTPDPADAAKEDAAEEIEIIVVTWWTSLDAIRGFAGADLAGAVVADEAAALLTSFDRRVRHYEVVLEDNA